MNVKNLAGGLFVGGLLAILLFPPWTRTFQLPGLSQTTFPAGCHFIGLPPWAQDLGEPRSTKGVFGVRIDFGMLAIEVLCLTVLFAAILFRRRLDLNRSPTGWDGTRKLDSAVPQIIGKRIDGVVVKAGESPKRQLFLVFSDRTYYEFYTGDDGQLYGAGAIDNGHREEVLKYLSPPQEVLLDVFRETVRVPRN